jgi:hypothetical protein
MFSAALLEASFAQGSLLSSHLCPFPAYAWHPLPPLEIQRVENSPPYAA